MNKSQIIAKVLKINLTLAVSILIIGLFSQILKQSCSDKIISIGLLYVILMPLIRVLLELIYFIKTKNYTYIVICLALFAVIGISIAVDMVYLF
ncbi:MAG: putative membrane protein [Francisella sp.]|jgi:uncharacterized membrane protein